MIVITPVTVAHNIKHKGLQCLMINYGQGKRQLLIKNCASLTHSTCTVDFVQLHERSN